MRTVRRRAYAKINLALSLAAPEPAGTPRAGWHRISTWMHAIDLADEVLVEPLASGVSTWSGAWAPDAPRPELIDWPVERDLAWRALRALEAHTGRPLPTRVVLTKRVPTGAGLGGGSADAGAMLLALDEAWGLGLSDAALRQIGAGLGSDVPFFVDRGDEAPGSPPPPPRPAVVGGFGEQIERTPRTVAELVLMVPGFGCATGRVYAAFDGMVRDSVEGVGTLRAERVAALAGAGGIDPGSLWNDLAEPACAVRPALGQLRREAERVLGLRVHITGSGSAMFAVVSAGSGSGAAAAVRRELPELVALTTRLL